MASHKTGSTKAKATKPETTQAQPQTAEMLQTQIAGTEIKSHIIKENEIKKEDIAKTYHISGIKAVVGDKMVVELDGQQVVLPKSDRKQIITTMEGVGKVLIIIDKVKDGPGRPTNPLSNRQLDIKAKDARRAELKAQGIELKQGRPIKPGSARQQQIAEREAKYADVISAKRTQMGAAGKDLTDSQILEQLKLERGRPVDPNSQRQQDLADRAERAMATGGIPQRGRPKEKFDDVEVLDSAPMILEEGQTLEQALAVA